MIENVGNFLMALLMGGITVGLFIAMVYLILFLHYEVKDMRDERKTRKDKAGT